MTDAEQAFAAAQKEIARVKAEGGEILRLDGQEFRALEQLPEEIASLKSIEIVDLGNTQVSDIAPLAGLQKLLSLNINHTQVSDIAPLARLQNLLSLHLNYTQVSDIAPLAGLQNLEELSLDNTQVSDIAPLARLQNLKQLFLNNTHVSDITSLARLQELLFLHINHTQVSDIAPLARLQNLEELYLDNTQVSDIAPLAGVQYLKELYLGNTQVSDIAPLAGLQNLYELSLNNTQVSDIAVLSRHQKLQWLHIIGARIVDLRPISDIRHLDEGSSGGVWFKRIPALDHDPELARLSEIEDDSTWSSNTRTKAVQAYLRTLPPYPEPLPWQVTDDNRSDSPPETPKPTPAPLLVLTEDARIDLAAGTPSDADLSDPVKERIYARVPDAVQKLVRVGNRFPQVADAANTLRDLTAVPFSDADILSIHFELAALTDVKSLDPEQPEAERLDADCKAALNAVLRLLPPLTMGHPDVEIIEERNAEYALSKRSATVAEGERRVADGVAIDDHIATQRVRDQAERLAKAGDDGRVANHRTEFSRSVIISLSTVAGALGQAAIGYIPGTAVAHAVDFLLLHKNAIIAMSAGWGENGYAWAEYILYRCKKAVDDAQK